MKRTFREITNIRRAVCTMANSLRKAGYSLQQAFRKAWRRVRSMTFRAAGVTYANRQQCLAFLKQFRPEDLLATLEREPQNRFDQNAIRIVVHILPIAKKTVIGYVPAALAASLAAIMDKGIAISATLTAIIGGYDYKENYGALIQATI